MPRCNASPILASLLAALLLLGNAPAWWHCGGCRSAAEPAASADSGVKRSACGCGRKCLAQRAAQAEKPAAVEIVKGGQPEHDESTCLACRTAIAGTTTTLQVTHSLPAQAAFYFAGSRPLPLLIASRIESACPRGPPVYSL